jgi:hypothetical protein
MYDIDLTSFRFLDPKQTAIANSSKHRPTPFIVVDFYENIIRQIKLDPNVPVNDLPGSAYGNNGTLLATCVYFAVCPH